MRTRNNVRGEHNIRNLESQRPPRPSADHRDRGGQLLTEAVSLHGLGEPQGPFASPELITAGPGEAPE